MFRCCLNTKKENERSVLISGGEFVLHYNYYKKFYPVRTNTVGAVSTTSGTSTLIIQQVGGGH